MMQLLSAEQIRAWDAYTIAHEPISGYDLMERASAVFTDWFASIYAPDNPVVVFCGTGNNGGDGLAIARMLHQRFYDVSVYVCRISTNETPDFRQNLTRLPHRADLLKNDILENGAWPPLPPNAVVIDAMLGSGLTRPVTGYWADFFRFLNDSEVEIVSVDVPSGLFSDRHTEGAVIRAQRVFSFEIPKLAFFFAENYPFVRRFDYGSIGLDPRFLNQISAQNRLITPEWVRQNLKKRGRFDHKGHFGHALLVIGSSGMAGAAILAAQACMRSGVGLLTVHTPQYNRPLLQISVPEAMVLGDANADFVSECLDDDRFQTVGLGCGLGKDAATHAALEQYLRRANRPIVLDADALNIVAEHPEWLALVPKNSILTPHPKEFERLFGKSAHDFQRLELLRENAQKWAINIVLKGGYTLVADTEGCVSVNPTGNPGMATAGSGDVLTGIVTGLLAQGYEPPKAARLGVYLHGLAGDVAAEKFGQEALAARDIAENLSEAFKKTHN